MFADDLRILRDIGELDLDHAWFEEIEHRRGTIDAQLDLELRLRRRVGIFESMMIEPRRIAHLDKALGRVAHEQQFLIAETIEEVGEKRGLSAVHVEGIVHEAARLGFVAERNPRRSKRLLPGMREVEGVAPLVTGGPETHASDPGGRRRIASRWVCDK